MTTSLDPNLHWTEHYARHGFAVVKNLIEPDFLAAALDEVKRLVGLTLPLDQWDVSNVPQGDFRVVGGDHTPVLKRVYDQPRLRGAIDEMFGSPAAFNQERSFQLFVKPFDPNAKPELRPRGHIDFVNAPMPVFGSGFLFQVSLVDKEPFGGNITVWPGTHKLVQRCVMNDPNWRFPKNWSDIPTSEPFEFVPQAGDVLFFHHLIAHEGNPCCTRMPRISLHCQATRDDWLTAVDPDNPDLSPWERSLAQNGAYQTRSDERKLMLDFWADQSSHEQKQKRQQDADAAYR